MAYFPEIIVVLFTYLLLVVSGVVHAAGTGGMSDEQMRNMMENMEKMQKCFENIDQSAMENLEKEGQRVGAEIESLCKAGKRDEAQVSTSTQGL